MAFRRPNPLDLLIVVGVVIATALFGIFSRPVGFLALVWPANAILLGMMVRQPRLASVWCWLVATITFVAVDLATGKDLVPALGLAGANIAGVFAGWVAFQFLGEQHRRLSQPLSILYMLIAVTIASVASALVGCWMAPSLLGRDLLSGFVFWFVSELVNYVVVLPAALTFPAWLPSGTGVPEIGRSFPC